MMRWIVYAFLLASLVGCAAPLTPEERAARAQELMGYGALMQGMGAWNASLQRPRSTIACQPNGPGWSCR